jgi:hypothetical protein
LLLFISVNKPIRKERMSKLVKYHSIKSCNSCGGANRTLIPSIDEGGIYESKTKCDDCGFTDYWAYGFYESSQSQESKCDTYDFSK